MPKITQNKVEIGNERIFFAERDSVRAEWSPFDKENKIGDKSTLIFHTVKGSGRGLLCYSWNHYGSGSYECDWGSEHLYLLSESSDQKIRSFKSHTEELIRRHVKGSLKKIIRKWGVEFHDFFPDPEALRPEIKVYAKTTEFLKDCRTSDDIINKLEEAAKS